MPIIISIIKQADYRGALHAQNTCKSKLRRNTSILIRVALVASIKTKKWDILNQGLPSQLVCLQSLV